MGKNNYDDWNDANTEGYSSGRTSISGFSQSKSSLIFLFTVIAFTIINIVNTYSSSFVVSEELSGNSATYLIVQAFYVFIGAVLSFFLLKIPSNVIKPSSAFLVFFNMIGLIAAKVGNISLLSSNTFIHFVFGSSILYWSSFFSNRDNKIENLKDILVPAFFAIATLFFILVNSGYVYAVLYMAVTVLLFLLFGVKLSVIILIVLYALLPVAVYVLTDIQRVRDILDFIVPGIYMKTGTNLKTAVKGAIASGSVFGTGLGKGQFKYILGKEITGKYAFCNLAEEMGFLGVAFVFILVFNYVRLSYKSSENSKAKDLFSSNCALGYSTMFVIQVLSNLLDLLGIFPFDGVTFPFLSSGPEIIIILLESVLIFRCIREDNDNYESKEVREVSNES